MHLLLSNICNSRGFQASGTLAAQRNWSCVQRTSPLFTKQGRFQSTSPTRCGSMPALSPVGFRGGESYAHKIPPGLPFHGFGIAWLPTLINKTLRLAGAFRTRAVRHNPRIECSGQAEDTTSANNGAGVARISVRIFADGSDSEPSMRLVPTLLIASRHEVYLP